MLTATTPDLRAAIADDVPLTAEVCISSVLTDLCRLLGVPTPAPVAAALSAEVTA